MPGAVPFFQQVLLGNTMRAWLAAAIVAVAVFAALWLLKTLLRRHLSKLAARTETQVDDLLIDLLGRVRPLVLVVLAIFAGSLLLKIPDEKQRILQSAAIVALLLQAAFWGNRLITYWLTHYLERRGEVDAAARTTISTLSFVGRIVLWSLLLLLALDNLGVKVTGLITGLGIGGIAVALAAQEVLKDLFASLTIAMDKPFLIGDYVMVGDLRGTVEYIGIKTTRLRSLTGEQLVFANSDIIATRLRNYGRMERRRVAHNIGLVYQTPPDRVELAVRIIREAVARREGITLDRCHFAAFGDSALVLELVYFVETGDYLTYMENQQAINFEILTRFNAEGIGFAYPTQTIWMAEPGSGANAEGPPQAGGPSSSRSGGAGG